jgi:hypothetical protein
MTREDNEFQNKIYRDKFLNSAALSVTRIDWALNWSPQCIACKSERRGKLGVGSDLGFQLSDVILVQGFLTPENRADRLSRSFGKKLPLLAA